jgi:hypothetical protein
MGPRRLILSSIHRSILSSRTVTIRLSLIHPITVSSDIPVRIFDSLLASDVISDLAISLTWGSAAAITRILAPARIPAHTRVQAVASTISSLTDLTRDREMLSYQRDPETIDKLARNEN